LGNAKSWGLYVADAQRWPERRAEAGIQRTRAIFAFEQEQGRSEEALRRAAQESSAELADVSVANELAVPHCGRCNNFGLAGGFSGPAEWCDCEHARRLRERDPNYIESYNARCAKTWSTVEGTLRPIVGAHVASRRMTA